MNIINFPSFVKKGLLTLAGITQNDLLIVGQYNPYAKKNGDQYKERVIPVKDLIYTPIPLEVYEGYFSNDQQVNPDQAIQFKVDGFITGTGVIKRLNNFEFTLNDLGWYEIIVMFTVFDDKQTQIVVELDHVPYEITRSAVGGSEGESFILHTFIENTKNGAQLRVMNRGINRLTIRNYGNSDKAVTARIIIKKVIL